MPRISVKLSERLHQQVLFTLQELNLEYISDAIKLLLNSGLEAQNSPTSQHHRGTAFLHDGSH